MNAQQKSKCSQHIAHLVHSYNFTPNETTEYTPDFLIFGREPELPVDAALGVQSEEAMPVTYGMYIYIYIYAFSRCFYPKRLTVHSGYNFFLSVCVFPGN